MIEAIRRFTGRVERERRALENKFLGIAQRFARIIRMNAFAAARLDLDPLPVIAATIDGQRGRGKSLARIVAESMLIAWLLGLRRTFLETPDTSFADRPAQRPGQTAHDWLIEWLGLQAADLRPVEARFAGSAASAVSDLKAAVTAELTGQPPPGGEPSRPIIIPGGAGFPPEPPLPVKLASIRRHLEARGISADPAHDYALANLVSTQILKGYGQGQWTGHVAAIAGRPLGNVPPMGVIPEPPATKATAFRHLSILDERTTEICDVIGRNGPHGTTLPVDHPYWQTHWPPLHYNCRSIILPIFGAFVETEVPDVEAMAGFGSPW